MIKYIGIVFLVVFLSSQSLTARAEDKFLQNQEVKKFSDMMVNKHHFTTKEMKDIFTEAKFIPAAVKSSNHPAEALSWKAYSKRIITAVKIQYGIKYFKKHRTDLRMAQAIYGVNDYIIAGILGIETDYGRYPMRYRAVDALASLAFFYPRRGAFFENELEALLIYAKKNETDPFYYKSSYAGAIGIPQFMPSNALAYAVDADLDGKADIINSQKDSIYSVGNFLKHNKWEKGKPIVSNVRLKGTEYKKYLKKNPCSKGAMTTVGELKKAGVIFPMGVANSIEGALFPLETIEGTEYCVGFHNLCVIYRYNPNMRYAMAINSLGTNIGCKKFLIHKKR